MIRDRGPERIRLNIKAGDSVNITFLGDERTRVESNQIYIRQDIHSQLLQKLSEKDEIIYELQEKLFLLEYEYYK